MRYTTCEDWENAYNCLKRENDRNKEVARELSLAREKVRIELGELKMSLEKDKTPPPLLSGYPYSPF